MATQIVPQVRVFQEFSSLPSEITSPLRAFIFGPDYRVVSYDASSESKATVRLGDYDPAVDSSYQWPDRKPGEQVDLKSVKVFFENALIQYYASSGNVTLHQNLVDINPLTSTGGWKTFGAYLRFAAIPRDVQIGDIVKIGAVEAKVTGFKHETIPSSVSGVSASSSNLTTSTGSATEPSGQGFSNAVSGGSATYTFTNFRPYEAVKKNSITYTFEIITPGMPGTAVAKITSTDGVDNVAAFVMPTSGTVPFGTFGGQVSFTYPAAFAGFTVGQKWTVVMTAAYTASTPTLSGTYAGAYSGPFTVTILKGGRQGTSEIRLNVSSSSYSSGVLTIAASATSVPIPGLGLTLAIAANSTHSVGNVYTFTATAEKPGRVRYLQISQFYASSTNQPISLCAVRNVYEVLAPRFNAPGVYNWSASSDTITLHSQIVSYMAHDATLSGHPIIKGTAYVSYRALTTKNADTVHTITDLSELPHYFSNITPENPLGFAVKKALENSNGVAVKFMAVPTNDMHGYMQVLDAVLEREDVYSFVPLTRDPAILQTVVGHVHQQSTPEKGRWRIAWVTTSTASTVPITPTSSSVFAQISGTAGPSGYLDVELVDPNVDFVALGVRPGDVVRTEFSINSVGEPTYNEYVIDQVISSTRLKLMSGPQMAYNTPDGIQIEIWRNLSLDEQVAYLSAKNTFKSRRVYVVIGGHQNEADGFQNVDDMFLAAAYAGLRGSAAPHQGLTNVALNGFSKVYWTSNVLRAYHRDGLMNGGFWVVEQNAVGDVYCRKQLSSDITDLNTAEQSITTNVDSISYYMKKTLAPYIGRVNNVESVHNLIKADILSAFDYFTNNKTITLGSQILPGTEIAELRPHAVLKDRLVIRINLVIPYPLNNIDMYLVV